MCGSDPIKPFWVNHQLSPTSVSYVNSNFPNCLVNTSEKSVLKLSVPNVDEYVSIDKSALVTPSTHTWSLDCWLSLNNELYSPSDAPNISQKLNRESQVLKTEFNIDMINVQFLDAIENSSDLNFFVRNVTLSNLSDDVVQFPLYFSVRPYDIEGLTVVKDITFHSENAFIINNKLGIVFEDIPSNVVCLNYKDGDVSNHFNDYEMILNTKCKNSQASAYIKYSILLQPKESKKILAKIPLNNTEIARNINKIMPLVSQKKLRKDIQYLKGSVINLKRKSLETHFKKISLYFQNNLLNNSINNSLAYILCLKECYSDLNRIRINQNFDTILDLMNVFNIVGNHDFSISVINTIADKNHKKSASIHDLTDLQFLRYIDHVFKTYMYTRNSLLIDKSVDEFEKRIKKILSSLEIIKNTNFHGMKKRCINSQIRSFDYVLDDNFLLLNGLINLIKMFKETSQNEKCKHFQEIKNNFEIKLMSYVKILGGDEGYLPYSRSLPLTSDLLSSLNCVYPYKIIDVQDLRVQQTINLLEKYFIEDNLLFSSVDNSGYGVVENFHLAIIYLLSNNFRGFEIINKLLSSNLLTNFPTKIHPKTFSGSAGSPHDLQVNLKIIEFICQMLLYQTEDELILFNHLPAQFFNEQGVLFDIKNLRTFYGQLDIFVTRSDKLINIKMETSFVNEPKEIYINIPLRFKSLMINGKTRNNTDSLVRLPIGNVSIEVEL